MPHTLALALLLGALSAPAPAGPPSSPQEPGQATASGRTLVVEPASLELDIGESASLSAVVLDAEGRKLDERLIFFSRARRSVSVNSDGEVEAKAAGEFELVVRTRRKRVEASEQESRASLGERLSVTIPVKVRNPPLASLWIELPERLYVGTQVDFAVRGADADGNQRPLEPDELTVSSSSSRIAALLPGSQLLLNEPESFTLTATAGGMTVETSSQPRPNRVATLSLGCDVESARTGDVVQFDASAYDVDGEALAVPIQLTFSARPDDDLGAPASGQIMSDGRFVAETPGLYTIVATIGGHVARRNLVVEPRAIGGKLSLVGRGEVHDTHTSDLWVWEGVDGRDYAVTGTWGANGDAHFWDVTTPDQIERIATVTVDARTVNDVKVSPDGRLCVLSREGASNRKNGIVLVDVTNPREPEIISTFDDELTGGVHNHFVTQDHVYALSAGRRFDVIDIADSRSPKKVGTYELDTPRHSIHDVWITDGLAFSSNWSNGVHIVDVGNGIKGGSPSSPQYVASYAYPSGWNHAAFPFISPDTGKFYVDAGDEAYPNGLNVNDKPTYPRGWLHFIDFSDLENPIEIARYEVPEAGTHNLWIEGDLLYVAYYNGGVRVVDISGDLLGDLYRQGREIAWFLPSDPEGYVSNAPMVWGPQPYKGHLFFSDWNTGLWCTKLEMPERVASIDAAAEKAEKVARKPELRYYVIGDS